MCTTLSGGNHIEYYLIMKYAWDETAWDETC